MGHKSVSLLGFICACCLVSADDFSWVTHEPFATENLVSIAPSGPQQVTAVAPWPQQWHSSPMQQQQQQQQQQNFNPGRMLFHSSGPWNNHGGGGGGGGGGGANDIATVHLQGPGPGSWQGGNAPWQTNSVAFPWQMQQHQQQSQNHHQNNHQNHGGPPGDISLPWSTQQQGHIATFTSLPSGPVQHPPNPWQNMAPMGGGAPWQYQQNQNNHNNNHNSNNNNNHPHPPHQQQQHHHQQQSNQQHHPQQPQQQPPPDPSLPRTQVKLIYVPIPIVRSVTQQAVSSQQGQWQQQGGGGSGGGGGASVQVIWPQQQQQGGSQSTWQPGVKTRTFSVPAKTMGSAGAVIPIVISLQTTSSRGPPPAKSEFSPRVATSRADTPRSAWW